MPNSSCSRLLFLILCLLLCLPTLVRADEPEVSIELGFEALPQGRIGALTVSGAGIQRVRVAFLDHQYTLAAAENAAHRGFISAPIDATVGRYRLSVLVFFDDGRQHYFAEEIAVTQGNFISSDIYLPASMAELVEPDVVLDELTHLDTFINTLSAGGSWAVVGITPPFSSRISAGFGGFRRFNSVSWQRHTGIDYPQPIGTPISVPADATVVLVDRLPIRGNYVLLDHGMGLFSGYAHMQETYVESGDQVQRGDVLGTVGNTGRSLGPHLHWEVALGGVWIDPLELARHYPPLP